MKALVIMIVTTIIVLFAILIVLTLVAAFVDITRASYVPPVADYPYSVGGSILVIFCKSIDTEQRVAHECIRGNPSGTGFAVKEYHMTYRDNWVLR